MNPASHAMKRIAVWLLCLGICLFGQLSRADVVKPALIEINVSTDGQVDIEVRASIEALLTGINAQYKNTTEAPTAKEYDAFRKMSPAELAQAFDTFRTELLNNIHLRARQESVLDRFTKTPTIRELDLSVDKVNIPLPGYTKVPRISTIHLHARLPENSIALQWYYPVRFGDNAVRVRQIDEVNQQWHWSSWQWLKKDESSDWFSLTEVVTKPSVTSVMVDYIVLGFEHIVPGGMDHILFILGIFLLATRPKPLLWQVTMFTLAHTITLGLSVNQVISLPPSIVQPLIAVSIAYVAVENIFSSQLHRSRLFLVFAFGLLHGLGFAGALSDFGMPKDDFITALVSFNIGVELGQLAVISTAFLALRIWFKDEKRYRSMIVIPLSAIISLIGLYWTFERIFV